jgi:hypothetical protein
MSNEHKNANASNRGGASDVDAERSRDTRKTEQESQDALRHQQDEAHHKINRSKDSGDTKKDGAENSP